MQTTSGYRRSHHWPNLLSDSELLIFILIILKFANLYSLFNLVIILIFDLAGWDRGSHHSAQVGKGEGSGCRVRHGPGGARLRAHPSQELLHQRQHTERQELGAHQHRRLAHQRIPLHLPDWQVSKGLRFPDWQISKGHRLPDWQVSKGLGFVTLYSGTYFWQIWQLAKS